MILIDVGIIVLLLLTILFCYRLNGKIVDLNKSKNELSKMFKHFDSTLTRAELSMAELHKIGNQSAMQLDAMCKLSDDAGEKLTQTSEHAQSLLGAMESAIRESKQMLEAMYLRMHQTGAAPTSIPRSASIESALPPSAVPYRPSRPAPASQPLSNVSGPEANSTEMRKIAIESLLERISAAQSAARKEEV